MVPADRMESGVSVRHRRTMTDMTAIAQQELFEAPARTRVIVPAGCDSWWGVDSSTKRVAIGVCRQEGDRVRRDVRSAIFPTGTGAVRLAAIYAATRALALDLAATYRPGLILVEQPSGSDRAVNHELEYAVGVIQAAIYDGAYSAIGHAPGMDTVVSGWWKARACGAGNIYKTYKPPGATRKKLLPLEEYGVMKWARLQGYQGDSWDEADALGIAEAGRRDVALIGR